MSARSIVKKSSAAKRVGDRKVAARAAAPASKPKPRPSLSKKKASDWPSISEMWHMGQQAHNAYHEHVKPLIQRYTPKSMLNAFHDVTHAVGTTAMPDLPSLPTHKVGAAPSTLFPSLEPVQTSSGETVGMAPAAVSETVSRYMEIAGNDRAMRLKFREPLCHIGVKESLGAFPLPCLQAYGAAASGASNTKYASVLALNPLRMKYYQQVSATTYDQGVLFPDGLTVSDIALGFSMWRFCGPITFHYEPQSTSSAAARIDLAFTEDPAHPILGVSNIGASAPSVTQIDSCNTSVGFGPWNSWQLSVNPDTSWKYTYDAPLYALGQTTIATNGASTRQSHSGAIAATCVSSLGSQVFGRLLLEATIEFKDPAPISALSPFYSIERISKVLEAAYGETDDDDSKESKSRVRTFSLSDDLDPPDPPPSSLSSSARPSDPPPPVPPPLSSGMISRLVSPVPLRRS